MGTGDVRRAADRRRDHRQDDARRQPAQRPRQDEVEREDQRGRDGGMPAREGVPGVPVIAETRTGEHGFEPERQWQGAGRHRDSSRHLGVPVLPEGQAPDRHVEGGQPEQDRRTVDAGQPLDPRAERRQPGERRRVDVLAGASAHRQYVHDHPRPEQEQGAEQGGRTAHRSSAATMSRSRLMKRSSLKSSAWRRIVSRSHARPGSAPIAAASAAAVGSSTKIPLTPSRTVSR